jgi:hypothetical protein
MSQLSLVPCTSTIHGPIDGELVESALRVFDLEVVAGWQVEWRFAWPNTSAMRGETRTGMAMDNG